MTNNYPADGSNQQPGQPYPAPSYYGQAPYDPQQGYVQPGYDAQAGYVQGGYDPQSGYGQGGFEAQGGYDPQAAYPQAGYDTQGYPQAGYDPNAGYGMAAPATPEGNPYAPATGVNDSFAPVMQTSFAPATDPNMVAGNNPHFTVTDGSGQSMILSEPIVVGRKPNADNAGFSRGQVMTIASPSKQISRNHCVISVNDGGIPVVQDLNSVNGTRIRRDQAVYSIEPGIDTPLNSGDVIDLGEDQYLYLQFTQY